MIKRWALLAIGWFLTITGAVITPLPPPFAFGFVLLFIGLYILSSQSKIVRRWIQWSRHRFPKFSRQMDNLKPRMPERMRGFITRTRPLAIDRMRRWRKIRAQKLQKSEAGAVKLGPDHQATTL